MICSDCRKGGDFNWLINTGTAGPELTAALKKQAEIHHARCKGGPWCACQHKLDKRLSLVTS